MKITSSDGGSHLGCKALLSIFSKFFQNITNLFLLSHGLLKKREGIDLEDKTHTFAWIGSSCMEVRCQRLR